MLVKITKKMFGRYADVRVNDEVVTNGFWIIKKNIIENATVFSNAEVAIEALKLKDTTVCHLTDEMNARIKAEYLTIPENTRLYTRTVFMKKDENFEGVIFQSDVDFIQINRDYVEGFNIEQIRAVDGKSPGYVVAPRSSEYSGITVMPIKFDDHDIPMLTLLTVCEGAK